MSTSEADLVATVRRRRGLPDPEMRRVLRRRAGLSQQEVADRMGVDRATVARWETGKRFPRRPFLDAYAELLEALAREVLG